MEQGSQFGFSDKPRMLIPETLREQNWSFQIDPNHESSLNHFQKLIEDQCAEIDGETPFIEIEGDVESRGHFFTWKLLACRGLVRKWVLRIFTHRHWSNLLDLANKGVPICQPVACISGKHERYLITMFIFGGPFDGTALNLLLSHRQDYVSFLRRDISEKLGSLLGKFHKAGATDPGLTLKEIKVRRDRKNQIEFYLVPTDWLTIARSVSWKTRVQELGRLLARAPIDISPLHLMRAMNCYLETVSDYNPPFFTRKDALESVGKAINQHAMNFRRTWWRYPDDSVVRDWPEFHSFKSGNFTGLIRKGWDTPGFIVKLESPDHWLKSSDCMILRMSESTQVAIGKCSDLPRRIFIKRFTCSDWFGKVKNLFRLSRGMCNLRAGILLEILGIPTPPVVATIEKKWGPILLESYSLNEWIEGSEGLDDFLLGRSPLSQNRKLLPNERRVLRQRIALLFRHLHAHHISHGDMNGRNILIQPELPVPFFPQLVDLDSMSLNQIFFNRSRVKDLARLLYSMHPAVSLGERIRFFKEYCEGQPDLWQKRRKWFKAIEKQFQYKVKTRGSNPQGSDLNPCSLE